MVASYKRSEIVSGLFVLVAVVAFALLVFRVGGIQVGSWLGRSGTPCRVIFEDVKTLAVGAKVVVGGRAVGTVTEIGLVPAILDPAGANAPQSMGIAVDFDLHAKDLRIDWDSAEIELVQDGVLGRHHLALHPGRWDTDTVPATLGALADTESASEQRKLLARRSGGGGIDGIMASVTPVLARIESILEKFDRRVMSEDNLARIERMIGYVEETLANLREAFDDAQADGLRARLLDPIAKVIESAQATVADVRMHLTERTLPAADRLVASATEAIDEAKGGIADARGSLRRLEPSVVTMLEEFQATASSLQQSVASLEAEATGLLVDSRGMLKEGRPEIAESLRRLRRTMWEAELLVRKLRANPAFLLFGDDEINYRVEPTDASRLIRSGRAKPFGQRDEDK